MKNVIKKNSKLIIAFSLGFILSIGTVFAASKLYAVKVSVDTTNMPALGSESNVEEALTYLYQRAADAGLTGTGNHSLVPTAYRNIYETYLDPTNLSKKCTVTDIVETASNTSGCMRWYVYDWSDTNYTMILDRNLGGASITYTEKSDTFTSLTSAWDSRLIKRLITDVEIGHLSRRVAVSMGSYSGNIGEYFYGHRNASTSAQAGDNPMGWLFESLNGCVQYGCKQKTYSSEERYWLYYSNDYVDYTGNITNGTYSAGIRPVIEISKTIF